MASTAAEQVETSGGRAPSRRPWWLVLLLVVGGLAYALVFGELFLRWLSPQALVPRYVTGAPDGVRANMPGASFRQWTPEVDVTIRYNAAGMRDDRAPPPKAKAPGECRIALLGDSYFVGFESNWEDSFAKRLEEAMAARGRPCRVVNFAVSGFGHAEMLATLKSRVLPYSPDMLLVSVHASDGRDNVRAGLFKVGPEGLTPTGRSYLPGVAISDRLTENAAYRWAQENSHLYSALREWAGGMGKKLLTLVQLRATAPAEGGGEEGGDVPADGKSEAWIGRPELNRELILALAREGRAGGAGTMLVEIPSSSSRLKLVPVAERLVGPEVLAEVPLVSPMARFDAAKGPEVKLYLEQGHKHWTALGNRLAAEAAADALVQPGMLPPARAEGQPAS